MKKIFLQMSSRIFDNDGVFNRKDWNNTMENWKLVRSKLRDMGYELTTADDKPLSDCERIIFVDSASLAGVNGRAWPKRRLYDEAITKGMRNKLILYLWEGKAVNPLNYEKRIWDMFDTIMTWNDDMDDGKKFHKFYLPLTGTTALKEIVPFSQKKLLVNMTINKYSKEKNELYTARRNAVNYFDKHYPDDFDLYGTRWNAPLTRLQRYIPFLVKKYKTYRGMSEDKLKTFSGYKFALCYENLRGARGYVTEKIFDALNAHTVPIYWGADNIEDYISPAAFIDRRKFRNEAGLASFLTGMTEAEYDRYIHAGLDYLDSDKSRRFLPSGFCDNIVEHLNLPTIE